MITERKLLDLSLYNSASGFNKKGLTSDVASAVTEVDTSRPSVERTHKVLLALVNNDRSVINWPVDKNKDVKNQYSDKNEFDRREKQAGMAIRELLINGSPGECFAWVSPPGGAYNYEEVRLEVGVVREKMGFKILESYGIPLNLSSDECMVLYSYLDEFSNKPSPRVNSPEDIRSNIVRFIPPLGKYWIDFLKEEFPALNEVWTEIKNGKVSERNRKTKADARKQVEKIMPRLLQAKTEYDFIYSGALIERAMMEGGYQVKSTGCGISNTELLGRLSSFPYGLFVQLNPTSGLINVGLIKLTKEKWEYHTGHCRLCEKDEVQVGPCKICKTCEQEFDKIVD